MISQQVISSDYFTSLEISLHAGCKVNCKFCPQDLYQKEYFSNSYSPQNMSFTDYETAIRNLKGSSVEKLVFAGYSENFFNPDAIKIITKSVQEGFRISIITTTIGLKKSDIDYLATLPIERVTISLYSKEDTTNNLNYDKLWRNINYAFHKLNAQAVIVSKPNRRGGTEIMKLVDYCDKNNINYRHDWHDRAGNLTNNPIINNQKIISPYYCTRPLTNVLQPNGDLSLCCMDWSLDHIIGNLFKDKYADILNDQNMKSILDKLYSGQLENIICKHCHYIEKVDVNWEPITIRRKRQYETYK